MTVRIATNIAARAALDQLDRNLGSVQTAAARLGSGLRIVTSADDAAGLTIAGHLTAQINGLRQATANAQDAHAVAGITDGALGTVQDALQRMRRLVLAAANAGGSTAEAVMAYSREAGALTDLLDAIAEFTHSGNRTLLDGRYAGLFQIGANGGDIITLDLTRADMHAANLGGQAAGGGIDLTQLSILGTEASESGIYTVDGARGDLSMLTESIVATTALRAHVGAVTNQLDDTIANLQVALSNTVGARSNLVDADMADEASRFIRAQIQTTAAVAVLAQANSSPAAVLRLLDDARTPAGHRRQQDRDGTRAAGSAGSAGSAGGGSVAGGSADERPARVIPRRDSSGTGSGASGPLGASGADPSGPSGTPAPTSTPARAADGTPDSSSSSAA